MNLRINVHLFSAHHLLAEIFKFLITQIVFILVGEARLSMDTRPSVDGLGPRTCIHVALGYSRTLPVTLRLATIVGVTHRGVRPRWPPPYSWHGIVLRLIALSY